MSDTPKTDAWLAANGCVSEVGRPADFMRQLEREAANAESRVVIAQKERDDAFAFVRNKADAVPPVVVCRN